MPSLNIYCDLNKFVVAGCCRATIGSCIIYKKELIVSNNGVVYLVSDGISSLFSITHDVILHRCLPGGSMSHFMLEFSICKVEVMCLA